MHGLVIYTINVSDGFSSSSADFSITIKEIPDLPTVSISSLDYSGDILSILWTISDQDGDDGLIYSVKLANNSIEQNTECFGDVLLTCLTTTNTNQFGIFEVEVKVWDGNALEWSSVDTKEIELIPAGNAVDESASDILIGDWLLPIGMGIVLVLLLGYMVMSGRE